MIKYHQVIGDIFEQRSGGQRALVIRKPDGSIENITVDDLQWPDDEELWEEGMRRNLWRGPYGDDYPLIHDSRPEARLKSHTDDQSKQV